MRIRIRWPRGEMRGELGDGATARGLAAVLPAVARAHRWGDDVYFRLPVAAELEPGASDVVAPGTLCYWVEGESLAIPFGPTPVSVADECRLVTRVNAVGRLDGDPRQLASVAEGDPIELLADPG